MATASEGTISGTDNNDNSTTPTISTGDNTAPVTGQTTNNGNQSDGQQQLPATITQPSTQQNQNFNNSAFNMGQIPQQWQPPQHQFQQQQQFQPPQWQPPQHQPNQWQVPQPQPQHQWQPSRAQPLSYPQHSGYYPDQHYFNGFHSYGYPAVQPFPGQQSHMPQQSAIPPTPTHQQSAGTGSAPIDTRNNGGDRDIADGDGNQSEVLTQQNEESEEPQYFGAIEDRLQAWAAQ